MEPSATRFYIKETTDKWDLSSETSINNFFKKNKFYVKGYWHKKLFNVIMFLLKKLNIKSSIVSASDQTLVMKSFNFDRYDIEQIINKHKIDVDYIWNQKPRFLIMGQDVFQELQNKSLINFGVVDFEIQLQNNNNFSDYYGSTPKYETEIMFWGFKIILVPWINGCFLLPDI